MLNEQFFPSPAGLQGLNPGPLPGDGGTYANMRFCWVLTNQNGGVVQGWDKTNGYFYQNGTYANSLSWTSAPGQTNRDFVLRAWHDADNDQELDATESRRSVYVKVMEKVETEQLAFVPLNANITLAITVEPAIEYKLILSRPQGTAGWATFADGTRTQQVNGSTSVTIQGTELSQQLKNMRLRAVTESACGEPVESGSELFHRDFTVGCNFSKDDRQSTT